MPKYYWSEIILALIVNSLLFCLLLWKFKKIKLGPDDFPKERSWSRQRSIVVLLLFIIICGFLIRVWRLGFEEIDSQEITYLSTFGKESCQVFKSSTVQNIRELIINRMNIRFCHQPLTGLLMYFISMLKCNIPYEFLYRVPSLIFGVATIWFVFLLGKELFSEKVGLLASFLAAFNPFLIYYSRDLQPYSAVCFFVAFSYYLFVLIFFRNKYRLAPFYLITIAAGFFFHLVAILVFISQIGTFLLIWLKNRSKLYWKKSLLFYSMIISAFAYVFIFWSPVFFHCTMVESYDLLSWNYFYFYPDIVNSLTLPLKIFQTAAGFSPQAVLATAAVAMLFLYSLAVMSRKKHNAFNILFIGMLVVIMWGPVVDWYFYTHIKRIYHGYRWHICFVPLFTLTMAYTIDTIKSSKGFLENAKKVLVGVCLITLFISNIVMDYEILAKRQKPCFSQCLKFMNRFTIEGDVFLFPIMFTTKNFLCYYNKSPHEYTQNLAQALEKGSDFTYRYARDYYKKNNLPFFIDKANDIYNRIWVVDVRKEIFKRPIYNHDYADYLIDYMNKNYTLELEEEFDYINLYLFNLQK